MKKFIKDLIYKQTLKYKIYIKYYSKIRTLKKDIQDIYFFNNVSIKRSKSFQVGYNTAIRYMVNLINKKHIHFFNIIWEYKEIVSTFISFKHSDVSNILTISGKNNDFATGIISACHDVRKNLYGEIEEANNDLLTLHRYGLI